MRDTVRVGRAHSRLHNILHLLLSDHSPTSLLVKLLLTAIILPKLSNPTPPWISKSATSAPNSLFNQLRSSTASNESTPYVTSGLHTSTSPCRLEFVLASFLISAAVMRLATSWLAESAKMAFQSCLSGEEEVVVDVCFMTRLRKMGWRDVMIPSSLMPRPMIG